MANNKYTIIYSKNFINQFGQVINYLKTNLNNKIAADSLYKEVTKEIEKRSLNPQSFEKYKSTIKRKNTYYRIYVKNYTIFYIVKNNTMEIRCITYSKRNFDNII